MIKSIIQPIRVLGDNNRENEKECRLKIMGENYRHESLDSGITMNYKH